jgi:hypothetical protein
MQCVGLIQCRNGTLSLSLVVVKWCQKSNYESQSLQVSCSHGNLNLDAFSLPPGAKTKSSRYSPSKLVRSDKNIASCAPCIVRGYVVSQDRGLLKGRFPLSPDPSPKGRQLWDRPCEGVCQNDAAFAITSLPTTVEQDGPMCHSRVTADCEACPIEAEGILEMH